MNLSFLNPNFLYALAAGAIPILIHRLTQRKAIRRKFSAVRLLLQSQRVMARPQRLKNLILLALRVLTVASLVFMMARPVLTKPGLLTLGDQGAKVFIIDNSLSMGYREEIGTRYELAKKILSEVIEGLKTKVIVIPTAPAQGKPSPAVNIQWMEPAEALNELKSIALSFGRGDPASALKLAHVKLKEMKGPAEILILSDMVRSDWERFDLNQLGTVSAEVHVTFLRIGSVDRDPNLSVNGVRLTAGEVVVGVPARFEATVSNLSDKPGNTLAEIYISGVKRGQKSLDLKAGEEGRVYFELLFDRPGWINGEVRLPSDRLASDDVFYFPLKVREKVKVLIVDGAPRTSLRGNESYYLANALNPGGSEGSAFLIQIVAERGLASLDLRAFDALFLLNVARPGRSTIASFLDSGKPVFLFLGDGVEPHDYNSLAMFPWRIRELREARAQKAEKISQIDESLSALKELSLAGSQSLREASFYRYFRIEGSRKNLLALGNKDPLLTEAEIGKGRIFLFASSADLDWNDLPLKASYLPLIQGLLKEAVGLSGKAIPEGIRFGSPFEEKSPPLQVIGPRSGPGIYRFSLPSGELRRSINVPKEKSDLIKMTDQEIRAKFQAFDTKVVAYQEGLRGDLHGRKKEVWPFVLAFILFVLGIEMVVANKL